MLTKIVNGKEVKLSISEEAKVRADWAQAEIDKAAKTIELAKVEQKELLVREKVESLLVAEFAEIDAAITIDDVKKVKIK